MIITATSNKEAKEAKKVLAALGYKYKYSIYWSEEWNKGDKVVFLHKATTPGATSIPSGGGMSHRMKKRTCKSFFRMVYYSWMANYS